MFVSLRKQIPTEPLTDDEKLFAQAFIESIKHLKETQAPGIIEAIKDGDAARVILLTNAERLFDILQGAGGKSGASYFDVFRGVTEKNAVNVIKELPRELQNVIRFDPVNDNVINYLREYQFARIRDITREAADAIRETATKAVVERIHPNKSAKEVKQILDGTIGLTRKQAQAVQNFRLQLETGDAKALIRRLSGADKQIARSALKTGDQKKIDRVVQRYEERLLNYRARMIARTESIRAENAGRQIMYEQGIEQGVIDETRARRYWLVHRDERLCKICRPVPKLNEEGVKIEGTFFTPIGNLKHPPAHPHCRCSVVLRFKK